jgi:hypothetical protein
MMYQIWTAVDFLVCPINRSKLIKEEEIQNFGGHLSQLLTQRYEGQWFPDWPWKGQGYGCLRINRRLREVTVEQAAKSCGLKYEN